MDHTSALKKTFLGSTHHCCIGFFLIPAMSSPDWSMKVFQLAHLVEQPDCWIGAGDVAKALKIHRCQSCCRRLFSIQTYIFPLILHSVLFGAAELLTDFGTSAVNRKVADSRHVKFLLPNSCWVYGVPNNLIDKGITWASKSATCGTQDRKPSVEFNSWVAMNILLQCAKE